MGSNGMCKHVHRNPGGILAESGELLDDFALHTFSMLMGTSYKELARLPAPTQTKIGVFQAMNMMTPH